MREDDGVIQDVSYITRAEHRVATLVALSVEARGKQELAELANVSPSTMRRTLREFEERGWIRKEGQRYATTQPGEFVATSVAELLDRLETERELRDVWSWLPGEDDALTLEMCSDAEVSVADADDPYGPVNRFKSLLDDADRFRFVGFDVALLEPSKQTLCRRVIDGMEAELVTPPRVAEYIRSTCPDLFAEALKTGDLTVRLHDDLPRYGVSILDDRTAISGYSRDSVTVRVLLDTPSEEVREWAETQYRSYHQTPTLPLDRKSE